MGGGGRQLLDVAGDPVDLAADGPERVVGRVEQVGQPGDEVAEQGRQCRLVVDQKGLQLLAVDDAVVEDAAQIRVALAQLVRERREARRPRLQLRGHVTLGVENGDAVVDELELLRERVDRGLRECVAVVDERLQ